MDGLASKDHVLLDQKGIFSTSISLPLTVRLDQISRTTYIIRYLAQIIGVIINHGFLNSFRGRRPLDLAQEFAIARSL